MTPHPAHGMSISVVLGLIPDPPVEVCLSWCGAGPKKTSSTRGLLRPRSCSGCTLDGSRGAPIGGRSSPWRRAGPDGSSAGGRRALLRGRAQSFEGRGAVGCLTRSARGLALSSEVVWVGDLPEVRLTRLLTWPKRPSIQAWLGGPGWAVRSAGRRGPRRGTLGSRVKRTAGLGPPRWVEQLQRAGVDAWLQVLHALTESSAWRSPRARGPRRSGAGPRPRGRPRSRP